jgi:hypothetical protein
LDLYKLLKEKEPFSLSCHRDSDGIFSATILRRIFKVKEPVKIPPFNEYDTDLAIDLGFPSNKEYNGIVIDHHPDHPEERKYTLFWDYCPTGLILFKNLKDHIKPEDYWLVVGSLCGDGSPELVPDEIWDSCPELLEGRGILYQAQWKLGVSSNPLYVFLSSGINSLCRLGFPEAALKILDDIRNPHDLLENQEIKDAIEKMRKEESSIYSSKPIVESYGNFCLVRIRTSLPQIHICGLIGSKLLGVDNNTTYIVLNEGTGEISIRGNLAKYIANKMNKSGFKAGGHPGYCGANVPETKIPQFLEFIRSIRL